MSAGHGVLNFQAMSLISNAFSIIITYISLTTSQNCLFFFSFFGSNYLPGCFCLKVLFKMQILCQRKALIYSFIASPNSSQNQTGYI